MNEVISYSYTKPFEASQISDYIIEKINKLLKKDSFSCIITDACSCSGSDTINFSNYFKKVNSVEIDKEIFYFLSNKVGQVARNNIFLYNNDYTKVYKKLEQDIIFIDPPWDGKDYKLKREVSLELSGIPLNHFVVSLLYTFPKVLIFLKVPLNVCLTGYTNLKEQKIIYNKSKEPSFKILFLSK
jgi:hypothetical protein